MPPPGLEICVDSVASAAAAAEAGASRLELCSNLYEGGITPSVGLLKRVLKRVGIPVHAMIRPRGGDFLYSQDERDVMVSEIKALCKAGAHGVVLGVLTPDGHVDEPLLASLVERAAPAPVTFHRAIDVSVDPVGAIDACVRCGVARVLTSGGAPNAPDGVAILRRMVEAAQGRLVVAAGGGVSEGNAAALAASSGVDELHGSLRTTHPGGMIYRPAVPVPMGAATAANPAAEFELKEVDATRVAAVVAALASLPDARTAHEVESRLRADGDESAPLWRRLRPLVSQLDLRWPIWVLCFVLAVQREGGLHRCKITLKL